MPSKRVVVSTRCAACGRTMPLESVQTSATCVWCFHATDLAPAQWRWILEEPPEAAPTGALISGETTAARTECPCGAEIPDKALADAHSSHASSVACDKCHRDVPFRALGAGFSTMPAAVVGEGLPRPNAMSRIDTPCSNCGAPLSADGTTRTPACEFCGTKTTLSDDAWRSLRANKTFPFTLWTSRAGKPRATGPNKALVAVVLLLPLAVIGGIVYGIFVLVNRSPPSGIGEVNGPCDGMERACSADKKFELRCAGGKFVPSLACRGPKGCRLANDGTTVSCDYTFADPGDPCNVDDDACSTDRKAMVHCDGSAFSVAMTCKGPHGCTVTPHEHDATLSCDDHVAARGDLCKGDHWACSADRRAVLRCTNGAFAPLGTCKGPNGCSITENPAQETTTVSCDGRVASAGDLCNGDTACSEDAKSLLRCVNAHFVVAEHCAGGCALDGDKLHCRGASAR